MIMKDGEIVQIGTPEEILSQPADDYVEKFIEGVDRSQVYTAANVMIRAKHREYRQGWSAFGSTADADNEISSFVCCQHQATIGGILDADDVRAAIDSGKKDLTTIVFRPTYRQQKWIRR